MALIKEPQGFRAGWQEQGIDISGKPLRWTHWGQFGGASITASRRKIPQGVSVFPSSIGQPQVELEPNR